MLASSKSQHASCWQNDCWLAFVEPWASHYKPVIFVPGYYRSRTVTLSNTNQAAELQLQYRSYLSFDCTRNSKIFQPIWVSAINPKSRYLPFSKVSMVSNIPEGGHLLFHLTINNLLKASMIGLLIGDGQTFQSFTLPAGPRIANQSPPFFPVMQTVSSREQRQFRGLTSRYDAILPSQLCSRSMGKLGLPVAVWKTCWLATTT